MQLDLFQRLYSKADTRATQQARPVPPDASALQAQSRALLTVLGYGELATRIEVRWNPRMRSTAGMAYPGKGLIVLNPKLREFGIEEVDRTLRHELAHLLAHHRAGRRRISAHGDEWRQACIDLGLNDEKRCHDLPLPRRQVQRRHFYQCPKCALVVRRVRALRRRSACLACCRKHSNGRFDERFLLVKVRN